MKKLGEIGTTALEALLASQRCVVLQPVGSIEPHGPHLPLATDSIISEAAALRAETMLAARGLTPLLAPTVPYGVTLYAAGFAGAISVGASALTAFLRAVTTSYLDAGFTHVCLVNNHLEPDHDRAVRAAIEGLPSGRASVACPLTRRWGKTLSAEFKSGACHAGRYETSLVLAARADLVDESAARALETKSISLSDGIKRGETSFKAMGIDRAYTGAPSEATPREGSDLYEKLSVMIATEIFEAIDADAQKK